MAHSETDTRRLAVRLLFVIVLAAMVAGCRSRAEDTPAAAASDATAVVTTTTAAPVPSSIPPTTTSTTLGYRSLGEEAGTSETVLGAVTWRRTQVIPLDLLWETYFPGPGYSSTYQFEGVYDHAQEVTGRCLQIYDVPSGYLGLGPCPNYWEGHWLGWFAPFDHAWMRGIEVWFSPDGVDWELMTDAVFDPSAAVMADPFVAAEYDGRWVVIGWEGVDRQPDLTVEELAANEECWGCLVPSFPITATPAAWVSNDLVTWTRLSVDFSKPGMDTWLTSVAAGELGWVIFGIRRTRTSQDCGVGRVGLRRRDRVGGTPHGWALRRSVQTRRHRTLRPNPIRHHRRRHRPLRLDVRHAHKPTARRLRERVDALHRRAVVHTYRLRPRVCTQRHGAPIVRDGREGFREPQSRGPSPRIRRRMCLQDKSSVRFGAGGGILWA